MDDAQKYRWVRFDDEWLIAQWYPEEVYGYEGGRTTGSTKFIMLSDFDQLGQFVIVPDIYKGKART